MSLSIGIVGLPNVGKSTLFNALLKRQAALAANYPFATIEPNMGVVDVPDYRLEKLAEFVRTDYGNKVGDREVPEKIIPAVIKFYDIAGLVKGASEGEGLGNEFLGHIRETDAIVQVVRGFKDPNVIRAGSTDPKNDIEIINTELILSDLKVLEKRMRLHESIMRGNKSKENTQKQELYIKTKKYLEEGKLAISVITTPEEEELVRDLGLLTLKPMIYALNVDETDLNTKIDQLGFDLPENTLPISAKIESEISSLPEDEKELFMSELGIETSGLDKIIRKGYEILGLQTFLTMGPKEVRAWTFINGSKAPQAAGRIHTDFERGFISAEIINYETLALIGSLKKAKELGKVRLEGKSYEMEDGDIVEFRFSV